MRSQTSSGDGEIATPNTINQTPTLHVHDTLLTHTLSHAHSQNQSDNAEGHSTDNSAAGVGLSGAGEAGLKSTEKRLGIPSSSSTCETHSIPPYLHTSILPYSHTFIRSYFHTFILPYLHTSILSYSHTFILSYFHTFILPYLHTFILPYLHSSKVPYTSLIPPPTASISSTSTSQPASAPLSVTDCRGIVKTLVCGMKTITWGAGSCKMPGSTVDYCKSSDARLYNYNNYKG